MRKLGTAVVLTLILAALAGIVVSAVYKARAAAALADCKNNLKGIGLGMHMYVNDYDTFPAATIASETLPPEQRLSWLYELDPYIHARMDPNWVPYRDKPWNAEENLRPARGRMNWYICKSNPSHEKDGFALSHYVGISGIGEDAPTLSKEDPRVGFFGYDRQITLKDIKDGLATTLMAAETSWDNGPWIAGGRPTTRGLAPIDQRPFLGANAQFGGLHRGGASTLFADGSYRFLSNSVDPKVLETYATIAGGEQAPDFGAGD